MILVDTNVLVDFLQDEPFSADGSKEQSADSQIQAGEGTSRTLNAEWREPVECALSASYTSRPSGAQCSTTPSHTTRHTSPLHLTS